MTASAIAFGLVPNATLTFSMLIPVNGHFQAKLGDQKAIGAAAYFPCFLRGARRALDISLVRKTFLQIA
jgi:hypothetical protein